MSPGASQSPTKGKAKASSPSQTSNAQVWWSEAETYTLIDLIIANKASAGDGLNFKSSFWSTASAAFPNSEKGAPVKSRSTPVRGLVKSGRKRTKEKGRGLDKGLVRPELRPIGFNDKGVER